MRSYRYTQYQKSGFTLIELLLVVGILGTLLAITIAAINPARQFQAANNTKRRSDVETLLNAIGQYSADHKGSFPVAIPSTPTVIGSGSGQLDICSYLITTYVAAVPVDPLTNNGTSVTNCASSYDTNYTVAQSVADKRMTVTAPAAEGGQVISVTR
jgi:type IV pilus assembly protein PilA